MHEGNAATGLLVPHTASDKKGDKLSRSSRTLSAQPSAVIPVEEPKRKKRKYHPELVDPGFELPSHPTSRVASLPSQSQPQSQQGQEFTETFETAYDDRTYVGENNHPLFHMSSLPTDTRDTPRTKVGLSLFYLYGGTFTNLRPRIQQTICRHGFP